MTSAGVTGSGEGTGGRGADRSRDSGWGVILMHGDKMLCRVSDAYTYDEVVEVLDKAERNGRWATFGVHGTNGSYRVRPSAVMGIIRVEEKYL